MPPARWRKAVDQGVRDQIRDELDRSICVEAGAGTGKTTALVSRIVNLIASGRADVDSLVVITFTEKAAAELSARVREALEKAIGAEADEQRHARIETAVGALHRARLETIHAFAASLLHERPIEAELDPEFTVMTEIEGSLSFDDQFSNWLAELLEGEHPGVQRSFSLGMDTAHLRETAEVLNRYRFILPLGDYEEPNHGDAEAVRRWLAGALTELEGIEERCLDEEDRGLPHLRSLIRFAEIVAAEEPGNPTERLVLFAAPYPRLNGKQSSWADPEDCVRMKDLFREFRPLLEETREDLRASALLGVLPPIETFVADYAERRRREGTADFDDLLIWARDLLRDRPEVLAYFQRRFDALLIDEFQDTDPIQAEIALLLASGDGVSRSRKGPRRGWRGLKPLPGRLFVVGDPKQSIYRFRRADIGVYDEVKRNILSEGLLELVQNFRSTGRVIAWVNTVFDQLLQEREGVQPPNVRLKAAIRGDGGLELGRPPVVLLKADAEGKPASEWRADEADGVAALLRESVGEDAAKRWDVRDPRSGEVRPAIWRDVAILFPTRNVLPDYEAALATAGIPARHAGSRDYFARQEVRDLVAILRSVDDPADRISLVGALRSLAFGCSDDDLVIHRATGGIWDFRIRDAESGSEPVIAAFELMRSWQRASRSLSLPQLVSAIIGESRLVEACLALPEGPEAAANLVAVADQARGFAAAGGGGLRAFARWLTESTEQEAVEVEVGVLEETDDVVRLMTMHGAKGLEYPIVVLAGLAASGRKSRDPVPDEEAGLVHFRAGTEKKGRYESPLYEAHWEAEEEARDSEAIRLLYVAATRAKDHLVVPWMTGVRGQGHLMGRLEPLLPEKDGHLEESEGAWLVQASRLDRVEEATPRMARGRKREAKRAVEAREEFELGSAEERRSSGEELPFVVASSVEHSTRPLAAEASSSGAAMLVSEGPPLEIGDALHLVMERVSLPGAEDLDQVAERVCREAGIPDHVGEVREMAARCLHSPTVVRAIGSESYQREVPLTALLDREMTVGRADLVFRDADGLLIAVDYKTDRVPAVGARGHATEHFSGQADAYAAGLQAATGINVSSVVFVYGRTGAEVTLTFDG